ncbi:hypothetical protein D3C73_1583300 [compost metagenome]
MQELLSECLLLQQQRSNKADSAAGAMTGYIGMLLTALASEAGELAADTQYRPYAY